MQAHAGVSMPHDTAPQPTGANMLRQTPMRSPRLTTRLAAVLYLLEGSGATFGQIYLHGKFVVTGNAAATASNILANQSLYWAGISAVLLAIIFHITYTVFFYDLLKSASKNGALLLICFSLVSCVLQAISAIFQLAPMVILSGDSAWKGFSPDQIHALALMFLNLNAQTFNIYLLFFALFLIITGHLIVRSWFLPHVIGILVALAGAGYLVLLWPPLANALYPYYLLPDTIGEPVMLLWFLIVGVNVQRWSEQANAANVFP
jgi:hypothetical protein